MGTQTATTRHVYRQRSAMGLAAVCGVTGLLLLLSLARDWARYPRPLFAGWVVFVLALAWAIFVRPAVLLDITGVTLRNVVREVHIPWTGLTDTSARWNLKVFAGDRGYTAWAISSENARPKGVSGGMFRMSVPGRLQGLASAGPTVSSTAGKVSAQSVAQSIMQAKQEYDEAVAQGNLPAATQEGVRVTWSPLVVVVLVMAAIAVVVLSLA